MSNFTNTINTTNTATKLYPITDEIPNNLVQFPLLKTSLAKQTKSTKHTMSHSPTTVQPIKNKEDIERTKEYFHDSPSRYTGQNLRNYCLFILGINIGKRIGDILNLKVGDIIDTKGRFKDWVEIREQKTNKPAEFQLHQYVKDGIKEYLDTLKDYNQDTYLFQSHKGNNQPITRNMAWRIVSGMSEALELDINLGTHSLRKTFAYQKIQANKDDPYIIASVSSELNHNDIKTTYRYCGFDREVRSHLYMDNPV